MRRLNKVTDLKFSLLIFRQFHGAITRSQKKMFTHICTTVLKGAISMSGSWYSAFLMSFCLRVVPRFRLLMNIQ